MNVLLDAHVLGQRETGNETYVRNLLAQADAFERVRVRLIAAVPVGQEGGLRHFIAHPRLGNDVVRLTRLLPQLVAQTRADLVHVTYHGPLVMRTPMVVTIHDVSYRVRAGFYSLRNVLIQNVLGYWTARQARVIITVSEFCRGEIERVYPFARGRIAVTYSAAEPAPPPAADHIDARLAALGVRGRRFIFSISLFQPRKNLRRLARAFVAAFGDEPETQLVLAGENATSTGDAIRREFAEWIGRGQVVLPGYIEASDASALYMRCGCFAFPSLYEGFGSPIVEAMRLGAPILTSSRTSLPEVAGGAALLVDPEDEQAIAAGLKRILSEPDLAEALRKRGGTRSRIFDGDRFAAATAKAYYRALEPRGHVK